MALCEQIVKYVESLPENVSGLYNDAVYLIRLKSLKDLAALFDSVMAMDFSLDEKLDVLEQSKPDIVAANLFAETYFNVILEAFKTGKISVPQNPSSEVQLNELQSITDN